MNITRSILIIPLAGLLLIGCATHQQSEYAAFAQAGSKYSHAIDNVLVAAGQAQVDNTSWRLVEFNRKFPVSDEEYQKQTNVDLERLTVIRDLRSHAQELAKYFGQLNSLATSDAPERTSTSIDGVVNNLNVLSSTLRTSTPEAFSSLTPLAEIVVEGRIRKVLREELEKRKDIIREELRVQEVILNFLKKDIAHLLALSKDLKERTLVLEPLQTGSPLAQPEEWVKKRRKVMYLQEQVEELSAAQNLAGNMSKTFNALLSGNKDAVTKINILLDDIENILKVADTIKS
ncbi:MAG: hypothetical protein D3918_09440 [Candidatus Electrothrix sp. AX2]|nr:hypothetical protein [Candidatus Electrothrix gigas]